MKKNINRHKIICTDSDEVKEFLDLIKIKKKKSECIDEYVEETLLSFLDCNIIREHLKGSFLRFKDDNNGLYSSGRKIKELDNWSRFYEFLFNEKNNCIGGQFVYFCEEELESYARSYRIISFKECLQLVKIFEFKAPKI